MHSVRREKGTIFLEPEAGATATVILMHGLGDTADGWEDAATEVLGPALPYARFILPTAPTRPITVNGGMPMPGWYDIESLGAGRSMEKAEGIGASRKRILGMVRGERDDGIPAERIVLAGFSQGGAMSLFTGLHFPGEESGSHSRCGAGSAAAAATNPAHFAETLGGILVMSGYLPAPSELAPSPEGLRTPILFLHGTADGVRGHSIPDSSGCTTLWSPLHPTASLRSSPRSTRATPWPASPPSAPPLRLCSRLTRAWGTRQRLAR